MSKRTPNALARYLADKELSAATFAELVGADRTRIWRCATGRRGPGVELAIRIEKATAGAVPVESWADASKRSPRRAA